MDPDHHPLHSLKDGYLTDLYLTHLAAYGHVYAVDGGRLIPMPSTKSLVTVLAETTRQLKFVQQDLIK